MAFRCIFNATKIKIAERRDSSKVPRRIQSNDQLHHCHVFSTHNSRSGATGFSKMHHLKSILSDIAKLHCFFSKPFIKFPHVSPVVLFSFGIE